MVPTPAYSLRIGSGLLSLARPCVMGILNLTPDSFFTGSRQASAEAALAQARQMLTEGADILDLGAVSTRPGADDVPEAEEWARLQPALEAIRQALPHAVLSVDTFRASVAQRALAAGANIVNDVTGGQDPEMWPAVAAARAPYILMHMRGTPQTMAGLTDYDDVTTAVAQYLLERLAAARAAGVADVVLDPGIGFAKTPALSFTLLRELPALAVLGAPLLIGLSRKGLIWKTLGINPDDALNGTTALHMVALQGGAHILRVHDVRPAVEAVRLFEAVQGRGLTT